MKFDKITARQTYKDFWDWLNPHPVWVINPLLGIVFYLLTTGEI